MSDDQPLFTSLFMCLAYFYLIDQYSKKNCAETTYFLWCGLAVTSFTIGIQFSKNIYSSIRWMTRVKKFKKMEYIASHKNSFKSLVKGDILHYDIPQIH